jgi:hypothetical protein
MGYILGFINSWDKYDLIWIAAIILSVMVATKLKTAGNGELRDWLHENGVKLLVLGVVVLLVVFAHHSAGVSGEGKFADWCMAKAGEALACFFGLIQAAKSMAGAKPETSTTPGAIPPSSGG